MATDNNNLILGKKAIITTGEPIANSYGLSGSETKEPTLLTDGKYSPNTQFSNGYYHQFYRGATREIVYELDEMSAITGFCASFLANNAAGVYLPRYCDLYISENGEDYMLAYSLDGTSKVADGSLRREKYELTGGARYKAKYVKFVFDVLVNVFCDELEVYGETLDGTELPFVADTTQGEAPQFDKGIEGLRDLVLLHCGYNYDAANNKTYGSEYVNATEKMLLPYVAYVDKDGKITDTMFDSILFCSLQGFCPSGGCLGYKVGSYNTMEDWLTFADSAFQEDYNMGALNKAVGKLKEELNMPDYKFNVVITLPYAFISNTRAFGDYNGDGTVEYIKNLDDRKAVYDWYMTYVLDTFNNNGYENLAIGGFYWLHESLTYTENEGEIEMVKAISELCAEKGTRLLWIPFYLGAGFEDWKENGFATAYMQPNYITLDYAKEEMFLEFAETVKNHNMSVEMEIRWDATNPSATYFKRDLDKYRAYLRYGYLTGYMTEAAHAYYQNAAPGSYYTAAYSTNSDIRSIYDDTYKFIKGTYGDKTPAISSENGTTEAGKRYYGEIKITDKGNAYGNLEFVFEKEAENGKVSIVARSGDFSYTPNEGFVGTDSFTVKAFDGIKYSDPITVTISVEGDVSTAESEASEESDDNSVSNNNNGNILKVALGSVAALGAVAAAVAVVLTKKKRKK